MQDNLDERTVEKKIRHTQRYHLIGNDCVVDSVRTGSSEARIVDVSNSGALVYSYEDLGEAGDIIYVRLYMHICDEDKSFSVKSVIKNVRSEEDSDRLMYGIEFIGVSGELEIMLKNYIYKSLTE